jgi:hypothetical protein
MSVPLLPQLSTVTISFLFFAAFLKQVLQLRLICAISSLYDSVAT